ncbi:hypothetical protein V6N11_074999 [Hibiscus sabdariffa]|uniref:RNase H type-1 domain-containing protein n=1 Tax=Hibiscus sabdariffa TaxID=183260 RepID=A0ABR2R582_9ROSI
MLWNHRCKVVFDVGYVAHNDLLAATLSFKDETSAILVVDRTTDFNKSTREGWSAPETGWVKANVDGVVGDNALEADIIHEESKALAEIALVAIICELLAPQWEVVKLHQIYCKSNLVSDRMATLIQGSSLGRDYSRTLLERSLIFF